MRSQDAERNMLITYLYNSGFTVETDEALLIFDCVSFGNGRGELSAERISGDKKVYFFVSHKHSDHFSREIFKFAAPNVRYILAAGTPGVESIGGVTFLKKGESFSDGILSVSAYGSTDLGVSFAADIGGRSIFFAGDLNCWHWTGWAAPDEEREARIAFTQELDFIASERESFDVAFFPVDPRMHGPYDDGAREFIARFKPTLFVPMHFREETAIPTLFTKKAGCDVFAIKASGDSMKFEG